MGRIALTTFLCAGLQSESTGAQTRGATSAASPTFEVASIRPNLDGPAASPIWARPDGSLVAINVPLRGLIWFAYALPVYQQVEGNPELLDQRFDVQAKAAGPTVIARQGQIGPMNLMMQNLLADRFGLALRWEERVVQGYALQRWGFDGSLGPEIRRSDFDCTQAQPQRGEEARRCNMGIIDNVMEASGVSMEDVASRLARGLEGPVVDQTDLGGRYAFRLQFEAKDLPVAQRLLPPGIPRPSRGLPSLFTALKEQLGLTLEPQRMPVRVPVMERVHPPTEN
jgi:uncharacterized protein (TIGR03435 family)